MAGTSDNQLEAKLESIERKLSLLRAAYDRYFLGLDRREPMTQREELERLFRDMARNPIRNTALNFRYQQIKATFTTYHQYWMRTIKQIEEGTFRRDHFKLKVKTRDEEDLLQRKQHEDLKRQEEEVQQSEAQRMAEDANRRTRDTVEDQNGLQGLFSDFMNKRKQCNERLDNVEYDKMVEFMRQQTASIKDRYKCSAVKFEVIIDGGKTKLKAIPVK